MASIALQLDPRTPTVNSCSPQLSQSPWNVDVGTPGYGPGASQTDPAPQDMPRQGLLPEEYQHASDAELHERIARAKERLGDDVVILGHFYQRDEVIRHADFVGDSFQLARAAQSRAAASAIVFCGVHFMAQTADILSRPSQQVILPNLAAGCSMADMANEADVQRCWDALSELYTRTADTDDGASGSTGARDTRAELIPVTYMNSSAELKAFCARNGGIVCTSSNAALILEWAFERGKRVLFFPDQHLGRNTAKAMGIDVAQMPTYNPRQPLGGNDPAQLRDAKVILWNGFCSVHKRFNVDQIRQARERHPDVRVIVHPECPMEVVDAADESGSTDYILTAVRSARPGATFAIGTEINMVNRLAAEHPEHTIFCLDPIICPCSTMYRIHPGYLAWVLEERAQGRTVNQVSVGADVAGEARLALQRMLDAVASAQTEKTQP